jgi:hypothetical protein
LAALVIKLDRLTSKPLSIDLSEDQKKRLREQLQGLADQDKLSDDEAKKKLDALLDVLKSNKDTLVAAGYPWPGERPQGPRMEAPSQNPFRERGNQNHLKALEDRLAKGTAR